MSNETVFQNFSSTEVYANSFFANFTSSFQTNTYFANNDFIIIAAIITTLTTVTAIIILLSSIFSKIRQHENRMIQTNNITSKNAVDNPKWQYSKKYEKNSLFKKISCEFHSWKLVRNQLRKFNDKYQNSWNNYQYNNNNDTHVYVIPIELKDQIRQIYVY